MLEHEPVPRGRCSGFPNVGFCTEKTVGAHLAHGRSVTVEKKLQVAYARLRAESKLDLPAGYRVWDMALPPVEYRLAWPPAEA